jgi:hypothetical protein
MSRDTVGFGWSGRPGRRAGVGEGSRSRRGNRHRLRPTMLVLEDRRLLSTFTVAKTTDDRSEGTLRWAIDQANNSSAPSTINFSPLFDTPQTITLTQGRNSGLELTNTNWPETIEGPMVRATVSGDAGAVNNVFSVSHGVKAHLYNLAITGGNEIDPVAYGGGGLFIAFGAEATVTGCDFAGNVAENAGGSILNLGNATLTGCSIESSLAPYGGGIANGLAGVLNMENCTITGNHAFTVPTLQIGKGGGLYNLGTVTLTNCKIEGNTADQKGGGVYNKFKTVNMTDCTVSGNRASFLSADGGGFYNDGTLNLKGCSINSNSAYRGGGAFSLGGDNNGFLNLTNCTVSGNSARSYNGYNGSGGGLYNSGAGTNLNYCTVSDNSAPGSGGGLFAHGRTVSLTSCTFSDNTASRYGGGVYDTANTSTITSCTFSGDNAGPDYYGGGLYNDSDATLVNCTFYNDSAAQGGGLYNFDAANLEYCTFSQNKANYGGGVYTYFNATLNIQNTIVAGNTAPPNQGPDIYVPLSVSSSGGNVIGNADGSAGWTEADSIGNPGDVLNPRLAPMGNYGGPTQTMALLPGSPAAASAIPVPLIATDQRGFNRRARNPDSGAFESSGFTMAVYSGNNQAARVNTAFAAPLVVKVASIDPRVPVQNGVVGFLAPDSGASCTFPGGNIFVSINGSGLASIPATANALLGTYTVIATTFGDAAGDRLNANFTLTNASAAPYQLVVHTQPSPTATAGVAFSTQPVVYVEDQAGDLETGDNTTQVSVVLASGIGPLVGTTTITVKGGVATFTDLSDNRAETISLLFTTSKPALKSAISNNIVVNPAATNGLVIHTQPSPTATAGVAFSTEPVIYVTDQYGNLETGDNSTQINVGLHSGAGPLLGKKTITVSGGVARFSKLSDSTAETITLQFTSSPALAAAVSKNIVVSPAAAHALVIHTQPSPTATAGAAFSTQPVIYVEDQYGNVETGDNSTQVSAGLNIGAGPLRGTTRITVSGGVASFTNLYDDTDETISLLFTSVPALAIAVSSNIVVSPASPHKLVIHTQPSPKASAGAAFSPQPLIYVEDQFGNLDTNDNTTQVTATLNSGAGPLLGTTTVTVSGGVATFTGLYDTTAETISLLFTSAPPLTSAISNNIVVSAAKPYELVLVTQPSPRAKVGVLFPTQPVIYVLDQYGNLETDDFSTQVTASLRVGIGPLVGTTSVTASGGIVTFSNLSDNTAERIILLFTSRALVKAQSNPIRINPIAGSMFRVTAPGSVTANQPISAPATAPIVQSRRIARWKPSLHRR